MMKKRLLSAATVLLLTGVLAGCGSSRTIKIGYVNPATGALAGSGEGSDWAVEKIYDYLRENPITFHGREMEVEIIVYDSQSDPEICREMALRLAEDDKVDLLVAAQTPETVIPVSAVAEEHQIPCVSIQAPVDPVANARESYEWTYHAFWTIDRVYDCYQSLWETAGFPAGSGAHVGLLFADDADGTAWHDIFSARAAEDGYTVVDPGQYPVNCEDFTAVADTFEAEGVDVITGTNAPPDFIHAMAALIERGISADAITMGKCCLLESDAMGMGELSIGLMTEIWWDATPESVSDLTGINAEELNELYYEENFGKRLSQPAAYSYAALELAVHAFQNAQTTRRTAVRDALSRLDVNTVCGPIRYDKVMNGLHYGETVLGGGQWQLENGELTLKVIDNTLSPQLNVNGAYVPGNVTTRKEGL